MKENKEEKINDESNTEPNVQPIKVTLKEIYKNEIDTSEIFSLLENQWKNFDTHFLQTTVQDALQRELLKTEKVTYKKSKGEDVYFQRQSEYYFSFQVQDGAFPFQDYFVAGDKLITYDIPCFVKRDDQYYALFFALKLSLIDPIRVRGFLAYQLETYFQMDLNPFQIFVQDLVVAYDGIINKVAIKITTSFFEHFENNKSLQQKKLSDDSNLLSTGEEAEEPEENAMGLTTTQQCFMLFFLLVQCGVIDSSSGELKFGIEKKAVHDMITALTNKNADNVKKRYNSLFKTSENVMVENLRIIRPFFERLHLEESIIQINKNMV